MYPWQRASSVFATVDVMSILGRVITTEEHFEEFEKMLEYVMDQSKLAYRKFTHSYRGFKVGCAVYAHNGEKFRAYSRISVFSAGNVKKTNKHAKDCAEQRAIRKAQTAGFNQIVGIAVTGKRQPDADSLLITRTLHCCLAVATFWPALPESVWTPGWCSSNRTKT